MASLTRSVRLCMLGCSVVGASGCFSPANTPRKFEPYRHYASGGFYLGVRPHASSNGQEIVYSSPRSGGGDIYCLNIKNSVQTRLTSNPDYEADPIYSPDGNTVAYIRQHGDRCNIWLMNDDGSHQRQLTMQPAVDTEPTFSPDGRYIVFVRWGPNGELDADLWRINLDGSQLRKLTSRPGPYTTPSVDNAGDLLFSEFDPNSIAYIFKSSGKPGPPVVKLGEGRNAELSPKASEITYIAEPYNQTVGEMNIDGGNRKVILGTRIFKADLSALADDRSLLFVEYHGRDKANVYLLDRNTRHCKMLTSIF